MVKPIRALLFDCMETLVDLDPLPTTEDYARWAFHGSGVESAWDSFEHFLGYYLQARQEVAAALPEYAEDNFLDRCTRLCQLRGTLADPSATARTLADHYDKVYRAHGFA